MHPITFAPESNFWPAIASALVITVVAAWLAVLLARAIGGDDWPELAMYLLGGVAISAVALGLIYFGVRADREYANRATDALEQQLGYTNIDLDGSSFTASSNGEYVKGRIVQVEGDDYIVVLESN